MAVRGNRPGSNNGGGMRKGQKTKRTLEREAREAALAEQQRAAQHANRVPRRERGKLAIDVLDEAMNYFFGLAATYQPTDNNPKRDEKKFERYLDKGIDAAAKLAPYQSQRLSAQQVTHTPLDLSKLSNEELDELERLHAKAAVAGGDQGGAAAQVH